MGLRGGQKHLHSNTSATLAVTPPAISGFGPPPPLHLLPAPPTRLGQPCWDPCSRRGGVGAQGAWARVTAVASEEERSLPALLWAFSLDGGPIPQSSGPGRLAASSSWAQREEVRPPEVRGPRGPARSWADAGWGPDGGHPIPSPVPFPLSCSASLST